MRVTLYWNLLVYLKPLIISMLFCSCSLQIPDFFVLKKKNEKVYFGK